MVSFVKRLLLFFTKHKFWSDSIAFNTGLLWTTHPSLSLRHCSGFHRSWKSHFHQFKYSQQMLGALTRLFLCTAANRMCETFVFPSVPFTWQAVVNCRMLIQEGRCSGLLSLQAQALGILLAWRASPPWRLPSLCKEGHYKGSASISLDILMPLWAPRIRIWPWFRLKKKQAAASLAFKAMWEF